MTERLCDFRASPAGPSETASGPAAVKHKALSAVCGLAAVAVVLAALMVFVFGISRVQGSSMAPAYRNGDIVWFVRSSTHLQRGTAVAVGMPSGDRYIKRVVAVPGDTVDIRDGRLYVNGAAAKEPYAKGRTEKNPDGLMIYPYTLPAGKYFVLGDNRQHSADSRTFGPVSTAQILGKMIGKE
jgi:signal peptidase I